MPTQTKFNSKISKKVMANKSELASESEQGVYEKKNENKKVDQTAELRAIPQSVANSFASEVVGGVLDGFMRQLLGQPPSNPDILRQPKPDANEEAMMWKRKFQFAERRKQEIETYYRRKEQENQQRLITVRQELKMEVATLSQSMATWAQEVEIATFQAPVMPSIYHEHFFDKLLSFVRNLKKRINRSRHWLKAHNAKSAKKKGLWSMAKKGNSFNQEILFSGERAVSMGG